MKYYLLKYLPIICYPVSRFVSFFSVSYSTWLAIVYFVQELLGCSNQTRIHLQQFKMSKLVENYLLKEPIGKGVYGQVFRAIHQKSNQQYAVKVIPKASFKANPKLQQLAINEINILSSLKNQNIVRFIQTLKTPNNFYFVYEYCNGGTLESLLQKRKTLRESEALIIFRQLLEAFQELNKNNIMHRDLKPDNIFFNEGKVKLGDFGFCKMLEVNMAQTMLGSPIYMAPEILKEEIYTLKADIWSLGVVLFEMLFGYCPFESSSISQLINVIKDTQLKIPKDINPISQQTETIIRKMLVKDQFKRIEWVDLFDFKIDEKGQIISGYKKDLGIEALEKYFLLDVKNVAEIEIGKPWDEDRGSKLKDDVESDKLIFSNKELIQKEKEREVEKEPILKRIISDQSQSSNSSVISAMSALSQPPAIDMREDFKEPTPIPTEPFPSKHKRWLKGIQLLDELSDCSDTQAETIFYYIILAILREINEQTNSFSEWTDVLIEQRRCLTEALRSMGKDESQPDSDTVRGELLRIWRRGEERWKMMWGRAIRFIYNAQGVEVETLLG